MYKIICHAGDHHVVICRKVNLQHIVPGSEEPPHADYWWDQEHDRKFFTFVDKYPEGTARPQPQTDSQTPRVSCDLP